MHNCFLRLVALLLCSYLLVSCANLGPEVKTLDGVLEFERTMQDNQKGILCGTLDTFFIGEKVNGVRYTLYLTLQKMGHYVNQSEAEKNQITVGLTYPFNNGFSIPLPPGNYFPLHWQCNLTYQNSKGRVVQYFNWIDVTSKTQQQLQEMGKDKYFEDPFPQTQILIERGKFTYIGKIKFRLPLPNTTIEFFVNNLKYKIMQNSEEMESSLKYGMKFDSADLPRGLIMSNKSGLFYYTYVSNALDEYINGFKQVFGQSPVFKKMAFDNKSFNVSLIRGVGLVYKDLR